MNNLLLEFLIFFAIIDYSLTMFWVYRWNSSKYVKHFKHKIPFNLIEANPIIRYTVKNFKLYPGITLGYLLVFIIQLVLLKLNWILGLLVIIVLVGAIIGHHLNNTKTSNKHIIKLTIKYNSILRNKKTKMEKNRKND